MQKLTINQVAFGSLKRRRGMYRSVILGAGLAIFFVTSLFLFVQSFNETQRQAHIAQYGRQNTILFDAEKFPQEMLLDTGMVSEVGSAFVLGVTEGESCAVGYFDEAGAALANLKILSGRMPEHVGEIAVERSFLQKLRIEADVGDDVEFALKIPGGDWSMFLPDTVRKSYRLVGILGPRIGYIHPWQYYDAPYALYPSAIVSNAELIDPGGRAIQHRLLLFSPGVTFKEFDEYARRELDYLSLEDNTFYTIASYSESAYKYDTLYYTVIIALVLIFAACQGVVNAFSANLSERRNQIGMMRAVGATSRQIRRIFGREILILSLIISPGAVALSHLFVWGFLKGTGLLVFYSNPLFLPLLTVASLSCVILAAWIPLFGASRVSPMQMIRDVSLLRARRRMKVRQRSMYDAPRLIASRHLKLYRTRKMGTTIMVALSILTITISVSELIRIADVPDSYAYEIFKSYWATEDFVEFDASESGKLIDADIEEIRALPQVSRVDISASARVVLLVDRVTDYGYAVLDDYAWTEEERVNREVDFRDFAERMNIDREVLPMEILVLDEARVAALGEHVSGGRIDMNAINTGREVILAAPDEYYTRKEYDENGNLSGWTSGATNGQYVKDADIYTQDMFRVGDALDMIWLSTPMSELKQLPDDSDDYITGVTRVDTATSIGASINDVFWTVTDSSNFGGSGGLITTFAGLQAMGIEAYGYDGAAIMLHEAPGDEAHAYLTGTFEGIAMALEGMKLNNYVQSYREAKASQMMLRVSTLSFILLLTSMCVSLVNHAILNRVRSDKRAIGTLRAVGAQHIDIVRSYQLQAIQMIAWGVLAGNILGIGFNWWIYITAYYPYELPYSLPIGVIALAEGAFLMLVALFCGFNLSARIREITRDSITQNIREL